MSSSIVWVVPKVQAPDLDEAFLSRDCWAGVPAMRLLRIEDGDIAVLATEVQVAWSERGMHVLFRCTDPLPLICEHEPDAAVEEGDAVGVFLDPAGERSQYMVILVSPSGRVADARVENPLQHRLESEIDESWDCPGLHVRSWSRHAEWVVEMLIPFDGITPAIAPPQPGDRWTGNFYRIERLPFQEISAWQPTLTSPPDLHRSDCFGILEFGESLAA